MSLGLSSQLSPFACLPGRAAFHGSMPAADVLSAWQALDSGLDGTLSGPKTVDLVQHPSTRMFVFGVFNEIVAKIGVWLATAG